MKSTLFASVTFGLLTSTLASVPYRSGEVKTWETFQYGRFETRMLASTAPGTVSSFFTYFDGPNWSEAEWNEIDVEITPSSATNGFSRNLIYGNGQYKQ